VLDIKRLVNKSVDAPGRPGWFPSPSPPTRRKLRTFHATRPPSNPPLQCSGSTPDPRCGPTPATRRRKGAPNLSVAGIVPQCPSLWIPFDLLYPPPPWDNSASVLPSPLYSGGEGEANGTEAITPRRGPPMTATQSTNGVHRPVKRRSSPSPSAAGAERPPSSPTQPFVNGI
jgi:hypothetical protein